MRFELDSACLHLLRYGSVLSPSSLWHLQLRNHCRQSISQLLFDASEVRLWSCPHNSIRPLCLVLVTRCISGPQVMLLVFPNPCYCRTSYWLGSKPGLQIISVCAGSRSCWVQQLVTTDGYRRCAFIAAFLCRLNSIVTDLSCICLACVGLPMPPWGPQR